MNEHTDKLMRLPVPPLGGGGGMTGGCWAIQLSSQAFWDVDMEKLDYEKQADYIIRKVFEHGTWDDILEITVHYGKEKVVDVLTNSKYLREGTMYFASSFLDIPTDMFKCYTTKQYHPVL